MNRMQLANKAKEDFIKKMNKKKDLTIGEKEVLSSFKSIEPDCNGKVFLYEGVSNTCKLSFDF